MQSTESFDQRFDWSNKVKHSSRSNLTSLSGLEPLQPLPLQPLPLQPLPLQATMALPHTLALPLGTKGVSQ